MASPIEVLHSRQKLPLFQDDSLRRGELPPRQANGGLVGDPGFAPRVFREIADIARDRKSKAAQLYAN
jgi:hypothetical protein